MNIEKQGRKPTGEEMHAVEAKINAFIETHSEYASVSADEVRTATMLIADRFAISGKSMEDIDDDVVQRALEARLTVRGTGEKIPVLDSQGMVIGTASSPIEAKEMARRENEARDLS
jgi:hypothetical protein